MKNVVKMVNLIKSRALNHRKFRHFLNNINAEHSGIIYFTDIRWLSRGKVLKRGFVLRKTKLVNSLQVHK